MRERIDHVNDAMACLIAADLSVLDFRCEECDAKVLPGARLCIDCKYGPLPVEGEKP